LSKGTVSKAVKRLEEGLGTTLVHRSSRRFAITECGRQLASKAAEVLVAAEAAVADALENTATPRGLVKLAAPMSFGLHHLTPALIAFLERYPEVALDLHLSDEIVDLVGEGFDCALRIAALADSSLRARKLRPVHRYLVASPIYLERSGVPQHPSELQAHACLGYSNLPNPETWRFRSDQGDEVVVRPAGPIKGNNADAIGAAVLAGLGLAVQPDFICEEALAEGRLQKVLEGWSMPEIALYLITPASGQRPSRVTVLMDFLVERFSRS
jgi:DNA-binding transcriptional LysR family regulator